LAAESGVKRLLTIPILGAWLSRWLNVLPSLGVSFVLHVTVLLVLGLIVLRFAPRTNDVVPIESAVNDSADGTVQAIDRVDFVEATKEKPLDAGDVGATALGKLADVKGMTALDFKTSGLPSAQKVVLDTAPSSHTAGELAGRSGAARSTLLIKGGGTGNSERAVTLGLRWLARHQRSDGNWSFQHGPDDPGSLEKCTTGATGLAILAFLGAGHTHKAEHVRFQANVDKGLRFLVSQMKRGKEGGDLRGEVVSNEGMYAHAIATLALCEAYGLTRDSKLMDPAQRAVNFIVAAQDPKGGGWRYEPRQPGDTTVTGWQVMALKSAKASGLKVPSRTLTAAGHFLDHVQTAGGSRYGYDQAGDTPPMTAIGLLCRMYLGWKRTAAPLRRGVEYLSRTGPSPQDIYYDYYATQVLHHWGGGEWKKWNEVLRDHLIESQIKEGDAAGSWKPTGDRGAGAGGRLYQTCLSVMTLEVYYRYLPLYQKETANR
jgi:hypothetical protein